MIKTAKNAREFWSDEEGEFTNFIRYLHELDEKDNPCSCPNLRVLPEDVKLLKTRGGRANRYAEGDLMCVYRAGKELTRRCGGLRRPRIGPEGLSFECGYVPGGEIHIKL